MRSTRIRTFKTTYLAIGSNILYYNSYLKWDKFRNVEKSLKIIN